MYQEFENEEFSWDNPNGFKPNKKIKNNHGMTVYCHADYAQELVDAYTKYSEGMDWNNLTKDLVDGRMYPCKVVALTEDEAFAQTDSGQTIYIDLKKEKKDSDKLNIEGIDFRIGNRIEAHVRKTNKGYLGSVVENYVRSLKAELFDQIKKETTAYKVRIESINKGGYLVDLCGIKCFMPGSLAAANKITDFESFIGKEMHVMMEGYVEAKDIFIVSYKKYLSKIMEQKIQELDLTKKYKGAVTGTSPFGIFVEWEEVYTGLIHKSEFEGDDRISNLSAGDEIEFYVKEIKDNNKLTLTLDRPLERNVILYDIETRVEEGTIEPMDAVVKHKRKNGVLVEIQEIGLMAFINSEHLSRNERNAKTGDSITVMIWKIDVHTGKIFAKSINEG
jgi:ribosomal protein S1